MKAILKIVSFELKQRLFSVISIVFFLMLVFQAIWYTKGTFDYYVNDGVLMNAPAIIYQNYAGMGMLMVIIMAIVTGGVLYKDIQHKTADWLYTFPVNEKQFYIGRILAAFLYLFILGAGVTVGNLLTPYSGIGPSHRFGSPPVVEMLHAILLFQIPNLLLFISIIFTSVVYTKKMAVGYLAAFLMTIMFLLMQVSYESSGNYAYAYAEPLGYVAVEYYYDQVPTIEKNTGFIKLTSYLLVNRLLWISFSLIIFFLGYRKFSFKHLIAKADKSKSSGISHERNILGKATKLPVVTTSFGVTNHLKKLFQLSGLEFLNIVRPGSFKVILAILMFMVFMQNVLFNSNYYIGYELPLTSNMTFFRLPWGVFIIMLLMIWSGELFFKERTVKIWQITDALPIPVWVTQLSKFIASCGLAFVLCASFVVIGIVSQTMLGGFSLIDLKRYVIDIFGYRWGFINFVFEIALVFFVAGFTGHRFLTHILSVGYFLYLIISFDMGLMEQVRYGFALTPGVDDYSEMSGYGVLQTSANWFAILWGVASVFLLMLGVLLWQRGAQGKKWYKKLVETQLTLPAKAIAILFIGLFFFIQSFLHKSIYANGNFIPEEEQQAEDAAYERKYSYLQAKTLPKYKEVQLTMDYYPSERKVAYQAVIALSEITSDTLFLSFKDFIKVSHIALNQQPLEMEYADETHHVYGYLISDTIKNDSVFHLQLEATKQYVGLSQSELQTDITENGSYGSIKEFLPTIGYDSDRALTENRTREDNDLEKLSNRMAKTDDPLALTQQMGAEDALKVKGQIVIGTDQEQIALAPGTLVKKEQKNGRNYFTYVVNKPSVFNWHVGSGRYKQFTNKNYLGTQYAIYANPSHGFNIEYYEHAIETSLAHFQSVFSGYSFGHVSLYEKHHWSETDLDVFDHTIVISEKHGWVADAERMEEKSYVYQTTASQIASIWVNDQLTIANVQGADMLRVAMPEALALFYVEKTLGKEAIQHILKKKKDKYAKDRNNEPNTEPPLLYADGIGYLGYNQGAIALYQLMHSMSMEVFIQSLLSWVEATKDEPAVFKDLYNELLSKVPSKDREKMKTLFETVKS